MKVRPKDDTSCTSIIPPPPIDMISVVTELHTLSSQELSKLIRDAENDTIQWTTSNGSSKQIDVEALGRYLPWHLIACMFERRQDEELYRYLLSGHRLLHTLCDVVPRNSSLEQVLVEDVTVLTQMMDLIFFIIAGLYCFSDVKDGKLVLLHSALLACSLYLFTTCISPQWHELAPVLLAHPKVDEFMFAALAGVRLDIQFLQARLPGQYIDTSIQLNLAEVNHLCQHCEASLQFFQSLCQQKVFRERLVRNQDLSERGGILSLAHDIMKLPFCEDSYLMAVVSRLKSKVLSILLYLCEVESTSFLDAAASTIEGLSLAKSTISQVLELLKTMFRGDLNGLAAFSDKTYPRGLLQLNSLRLTEILSDDSNFRSYITLNFTEVLTTIFLQPHEEFLSSWCSSESRPSEEDATLDFDSLAAAGWILGVIPSSVVPESTFNACRVPRTSYAFQRTSLLVKIVANLTCFIPDICKEEKDLFLNTFLQCFYKELPILPYGVSNNARVERAVTITQNLGFLLNHASSLTPTFLNQDDVQLYKLFIAQLDPLITQEPNIDPVRDAIVRVQESPDAHGTDGDQKNSISIILPLEELNALNHNGNEGPSNGLQIQEQRTDAAQTYTARAVLEKNQEHRTDVTQTYTARAVQEKSQERRTDATQTLKTRAVQESDGDAQNVETNGLVDSNTMQSEEKQSRKRKRNIMNQLQIDMMEEALVNEPEMQRKAAILQHWAEKISHHGTEISSSQLKNWLNNRKAKLARVAAKDNRAPSVGDNTFTDKKGGSGTDPESPDELSKPSQSAAQGTQRIPEGGSVKLERAQFVILTDGQGEEIGKGYVQQASGSWSGTNLDETGLCVVDVTYLKVDKWANLPRPSDATGASVSHAEQGLGVKRVLWDSTKLVLQQKPI